MLLDTAPIIALIDTTDKENHQKCSLIFQSLSVAPLTTWACLTEAFYFLYLRRGWQGQKALLTLLERGGIEVYSPDSNDLSRIAGLMEQYKDRPMDFADASLVALAEQTGIQQIFTLDDDFFFYRINGQDSFQVLPEREPKR
jgi:uncharacterized protein